MKFVLTINKITSNKSTPYTLIVEGYSTLSFQSSSFKFEYYFTGLNITNGPLLDEWKEDVLKVLRDKFGYGPFTDKDFNNFIDKQFIVNCNE